MLRSEAAAPPVFILIVPLFHVTGSIPVMLSCASAGLKIVIMYKWDPERALELIERERVTNFVGVPTQSWDLLESPRFADFDTSSLVSVGGGEQFFCVRFGHRDSGGGRVVRRDGRSVRPRRAASRARRRGCG